MSSAGQRRDLVALVADGQMEATLRGLLSRPQSLRIRQVDFEVFRHPHHDPGCLREADQFLRPFLRQFTHAVVLFDREGSGSEGRSRVELEAEVSTRLDQSGWSGRAGVVVIDPELEAWVWSDSPQVESVLGWRGRVPGLRDWLKGEGRWPLDAAKPARPKEAMDAALREARLARSAAQYRKLARQVSLSRCTDAAFQKLTETLRDWFGQKDLRLPRIPPMPL